jgi:class 3 adenylate cyclase
MDPERTVLLIADISGYTEYMRSHRMSLAHAEVNTARLLERVIDAAGDFDLIEIEGDAAFLSREADSLHGDAAVAATAQAAVGMHRAFHMERQHVATNLCPCDGCVQANNLKLKFVAHIGEVATQTIKQRRKLVGIDVILVHRLLKNRVQAPEYVLFSEELYRTGEAALPSPVHEVSQDLEGIGPVRAYFVEIEDLAGSVPPLPEASWLGRLGRTVDVVGRGLPYMLGVRRRRRPVYAH